MREIFKRIEDDNELLIEVNIDAGEFKGGYKKLFSVFVKYSGLDDNSEVYEEFLETKESLIIAVEYEDKAKYIGSRVVDGWSEFYFCASSSKELNQIVSSILKNCDYIYESNVVADAKWNFYETQLFPTELELIDIQSAKIIFLLQEENDDLSIKRDVEHYISFDTPTQKNKFLNTLDLDGFSFKDEISSQEFDNGVALVKNHCVTQEEVKQNVHKLFAKIKENQGYYEGWSTTLVNEEKSS